MIRTEGAVEEIQGGHMNGFIKITLQIKPVHLIRQQDMILDWDAVLRSNAKIACLGRRDVGHKKEQKSTELNNLGQ